MTLQKALVPVVYLAHVKPGDLQANGALIAAADINLTDTRGFSNPGSMVASGRFNLGMAPGAVLDSRGGKLKAGGAMTLSTANSTIDLTSAGVKAAQLQITSGADLLLGTASSERTSVGNHPGSQQTRTQTDLGRTGSIEVTGDAAIQTAGDFRQTGADLIVGGNLQAGIGGSYVLGTVARTDHTDASFNKGGASGESSSTTLQHQTSSVTVGGQSTITAGQDVTARGASIDLQGGGNIAAGGNIDLGAASNTLDTQSTGRHKSSGGRSGNDARQAHDETLIGTSVKSGGDLTLRAGSDATVSASQVSADGHLAIAAGGNVNITSAEEAHSSSFDQRGGRKGVVSSKSSIEQSSQDTRLAVGSSVGGSTVSITAGQDLAIQGSAVVSDAGTALTAGGDVTITAAQNSHSSSAFKETKKSGLFTSGGLSVTVGKQQQSTDQQTSSTWATASTVGAIDGNVAITAGERYSQVGSDVLAPAGDVTIAAKQVDIVEARETSNSVTRQEFKQSGLTLQITSPVLSAVQTIAAQTQAAGNTSDSRMQGLAVANSLFAAKNAVNAIQAGQAPTVTGGNNPSATTSEGPSAAQQAGGIDLSISLGASKSSSTTTQTSDTARGSTIAAGGNVSITATGAGRDSDILVRGSDVTAGNNATLKADGDIALLAAQNTASLKGSNKSSSGSIGISVGTSGFGVTASGSAGKGKEAGDDLTHTNTHITAGNNPGNTVTLQSGADTTLRGAVVRANTVKADVGGDLRIESLQDTSTYASKQQNIGASVTLGASASGSFNASKSKADSDYASVTEQSGIKAGDGGFQVAVKNDTDLQGAVIASNQSAVEEGRNSFSTGGTLHHQRHPEPGRLQGQQHQRGRRHRHDRSKPGHLRSRRRCGQRLGASQQHNHGRYQRYRRRHSRQKQRCRDRHPAYL